MKDEAVSKFRGTVLALVILSFALIVAFEGVAIGQQSNVEQPVLEINKTMISGETTVPSSTKVYWELEVSVTYNDETDLTDVVVSDTLPVEITLEGTTPSKGSVTTTPKGDAMILTWDIGTMSPGDAETMVMELSTKTVGSGRWATQYFTSAGEYVLNEGAYVEGIHNAGPPINGNIPPDSGTVITAGPTDPITVYAEQAPPPRRGRGRRR